MVWIIGAVCMISHSQAHLLAVVGDFCQREGAELDCQPASQEMPVLPLPPGADIEGAKAALRRTTGLPAKPARPSAAPRDRHTLFWGDEWVGRP